VTFADAKYAVIILAAAAAAGFAADPWEDNLPAAAGDAWTYEGEVLTAGAAAGETVAATIRLTTTVTKVERFGGGVTLISLKGHPSQALGWEGGDPGAVEELKAAPSGYLCIANKVFALDGARLEAARLTLKNGGPLATDDVSYDDLAFEFPLVVGLRFGDAAAMTRADGFYCWVVADAKDYGDGRLVYHLLYNTNPDATEVWFVPRLGITRYKYTHHGTRHDVDLTLKGATLK
jgi:hypothetical protein